MSVAQIDEYLKSQGYPVESVRDASGVITVFLDNTATDQQRLDAQAAADSWAPSADDKTDDAVRDRLNNKIIAAVIIAADHIAKHPSGASLPAWVKNTLDNAATFINNQRGA